MNYIQRLLANGPLAIALMVASTIALTVLLDTSSALDTEQKQASVDTVHVPQMAQTAKQHEERIKWFRDSKFGLFIHWGPAAISGEEISWGMKDRIEGGDSHKVVPRDEYMNLYKEFNPTKFDADALLGLAKNAGMKYIVFVAKHHDGFSLWDTKENHFPAGGAFPEKYSITDAPYEKDICKEIQQATNKHGLKLGWYYSTRDWTHPEYLKEDNKTYNDYYENQVEELLNNYGPVDILWFDHCFGDWNQYTIPRLYEKMYKDNPNLLVNNRAVRGVRDVPKKFAALADGDYDTPENRMGAFQHGRAWESCMILSPHPDHGGWSYRPDGVTRSLEETLKLLSSCVTGDGNMLLNIAPLPDGTIKPEEKAILEGIAPWMKKNGEAVYSTRGGPWINGDWGGATYRDKTVYLHLFDTEDSGIELNRLSQSVTNVETMDGKAIEFSQDDKALKIVIPKEARDQHVSVVKLTMDAAVTGVKYGPALANEKDNAAPGTLEFTAESATLSGDLVLKDGAVTNWTNPKNFLSWDLGLDSPGKYRVQVTTSCKAPGSIMVLHITAKSVKGTHGAAPVTGEFENYQTYNMGEVYFPNAESTKIQLRTGHPHAWKPVQVKSVKLIPIN